MEQLALIYFDADGDMHMECWDLDKVCLVEDLGRDNCKWNWSLPDLYHKSSEVEHMVGGVKWF